jgi:hypothetical protein
METISELVWEQINEIHIQKEKWDASYLSEKLVILSTLYANLSKHIADLENAYHKLLYVIAQEEEKITRAEIKAKAGDEYYRLRQAQLLEKSLIEEIRSIKKYIKVREHEAESAYNL